MASASATMLLQKLALRSAASKAATSTQLRSASTLGLRASTTASLPARSPHTPNYGSSITNRIIHQQRSMATVNAGSALSRLAADHPHMEIVRYEHKNVKWTLKHVNYYSDALACGFLDAGLQPGDVVLSWLPEHFAEQHILQFACSKAGLILYSLDPNPELAKQDPTKAKEALAKALELTNATILISQEAGDDVNYITLCEGVVPEIRIFDFSEGCQFFTPRYPHLRFPVHTGYTCTDNEGMFLFRHFLVPSNNLDALLRGTGCKALDGKTPLLGELVYGKDGVPTKIGKVLTNEEVFKAKDTWVQFSSILSREYREVPGVGVVF